MTLIVSIDPGKNKCGMVLVDLDTCLVLDGRVVKKIEVVDLITSWKDKHFVDRFFLGNGTTSNYWHSLLQKKGLGPIFLVEEKGTTMRARFRYWELWPPVWYLRFIPNSLILPPQPLDAVAALILLEDHLNKKFNWVGTGDFKI